MATGSEGRTNVPARFISNAGLTAPPTKMEKMGAGEFSGDAALGQNTEGGDGVRVGGHKPRSTGYARGRGSVP